MHIQSNWRYVNKGLLFILSFLVVSTLASVVYLIYTLQSLQTFTSRGSNAVATAFILQDLLTNVQELESGSRGYIITGNDSFLQRYAEAEKHLPVDLKMVQTDPQLLISHAQKQDIVRLTSQKQERMQTGIAIRRDQGIEAAQAYVGTGEGEKIMQELRKEINTISSVGLHDIGPLRVRSESNLRRALVVAATLCFLVLGTCIAVMWYFQKAILRERALESTKNEFLSLASHQLRTPATNVKQYLGLLMDGYMGKITEEQKNALQVAYKNNESEISIMNNLLDVAKLDLERIQIHRKVTNVMAIARHVVRDQMPRATERGQIIKIIGPKQVMASVDESYIKGVIENLVDNAIKYSKEGTKITVELSREQDNVLLSIRDQGLGIKKRDYTKLFNKFSRLDNEFSANSQGSGLGLYWVKQIVKLHKGTITVVSHEGKGSVFTVCLPIR